MRRTVVALLLVLGTVSAVTGTVAAFATTGKSACSVESSEDDFDAKPTFQRVALKVLRFLP